jgi:hypothetical protein
MELLKTYRHELKYTLSTMDYYVLSRRLGNVLKKDTNCSGDNYIITSLYFDDVHNTAFIEKVNGDAIRNKYRIRFYDNDTSFFKLERKSKLHQMTHKVSGKLTAQEVKEICAKNYEFLTEKDNDFFKEFYLKLSHGLLKPKVIVKYNRLAFVHPVGNVRITFDSNVQTSNNCIDVFNQNIPYQPAIRSDEVIMEIKFNGVLPDFIKSMIQTNNIMTSSSSKYVFSRKYNYEF